MRGSSFGRNGSFTASRTGGDDRLLEARLRLAVPAGRRRGSSTSTWFGSMNWPSPLHHRHLAHLGHRGQAAGQLADDLVLVRAQLVEVDLRLGRSRRRWPPKCADLVHHRGDVQQRLRRDAADVQADAAERRDSARRAPSSGRGRRRGRRPSSRRGRRRAPACRSRGRRCRGGRRGRRGRRRWRRRRCGAGRGAGAACSRARRRCRCGATPPARRRRSAAPLRPRSSIRITEPSLTLSPTLTLISFTTPACDDGISIDALSLSTVIRLCSTLDRVAGLHQHLDDADVLEVADVRNLDVDRRSCSASGVIAARGGSRRGSARGRR